MGLITWIIFGALAGWVASMIAGSDERQGCFLNIVVGVVGALIGGIIVEFVTGRGFSFGFNLSSFVVAVIGAIVLLLITGMARRS
jgi:uncharacterized membrane protein YeaQ/YmgE (transglycosylase-associated protein family)